MALSALVPAALASPMLAASVLPSSLHALRVLSRSMSTFSSVTAPVPASDSDKQKGVSSTWECLVGPLEKHMVETRQYKSGVMPQSAVFVSPLVRHSVTLMGAAWERGSSSSAHGRRSYSGLLEAASRRHFSAVPEAALLGTRGAHSAAVLPEELLTEARPGLLATWAGKVQPRFKGGVRKVRGALLLVLPEFGGDPLLIDARAHLTCLLPKAAAGHLATALFKPPSQCGVPASLLLPVPACV
jgi:hypothetical protein